MNLEPAVDRLPRATGGALSGLHAAALRTIAHDALLDHLNRGDVPHALQLALDMLGAVLGCRCTLQAHAADGAVRWELGAGRLAPDAGCAWVELPLARLGHPVGTLKLQLGASPIEAATLLEPLRPALAALLLQDARAQPTACANSGANTSTRPGPGPGPAGLVAMIRAALAGAGTYVWEWEIDTDRLTDIDEGLSQLGYPPGETGRTQDDWNRLIHPEDLAANHAAYLRHARGEVAIYEHAYRVKAHDGAWRWYLERGRVVERHADGRPQRMVGMQTDITERRAMQAQATQANARLEKIARHVPGVLYQFEMGPGGRNSVRYVSERVRDLLGLDPAAVMRDANVIFSVMHRDDRRAVAASLAESSRTLAEWQHEFRIHHADGAERWILGTATPQREADASVAWHGYLQDMTVQRALEAAQRGAATAEAANRAKTEFLSRMSHELRTPLNAVLGFAQLLEMDRAQPLSEAQRRRVQLIREAGAHLLVMIGDLLDLTRIESGSMVVQQDPVPLGALATEGLQMVQASAEPTGVSLSLAASDGEPTALADRTRLRQVLLNLLSNAVKYNRHGGTVEVRVAATGHGEVTLQVSDTGVGIAPQDLAQVFEPFQRGRHEGGRIEGTGIGLSVTRSLVQLMHGRIEVQSTPGVGSTFSVTLPAY